MDRRTLVPRAAALVAGLALVLPLAGCGGAAATAAPASTEPGGATAAPATEAAATEAPAAWVPEGNPTMIIHADAGGSSDMFGREIAKLLADEKITPGAVPVENRPGGSGAVAYTYMLSKAGDPNYLATLSSSYLTTPLGGEVEYSYEDFTNLAFLAADPLVIAVRPGTYKSLDELVAAAKANPGSIKWGGTQTGAADSILEYLLRKLTGAEFTYVSFEGGSEVNAAILGENVDVIASNPAEIKGLIDGGRLTGLAITTPEPLEGLDVPTAKSQGYDLEFYQARGIMAPPGITPEQRTFWEDGLKKVSETEAWKKYVNDQFMYPVNKFGADAEAFVAAEYQKYVDIYKALGLSGS
jgi:putative tricarboxylic transport membrane protein